MKENLLSPHYYNLLLVIQLLVGILLPTWRMIPKPWNFLGIVFVFIGLTLNIRATKQLNFIDSLDSDSIPTNLEMSGVFRINRNPLYSGGVILSLGIAILFGTLVNFIFPIVLFIVLDRIYIPIEEVKLYKLFGQSYLQYKKRVRRWI